MTELPTPPAHDSLPLNGGSDEHSSQPTDRGHQPAEPLIEEQEAARAAGVSVATLRRFVEVGALSSIEKEGVIFYAIPLVERLFSVTIPRLRTPLRAVPLPTAPLPTAQLGHPAAASVKTTNPAEDGNEEDSPLQHSSDLRQPPAPSLGQEEVAVFKQVLEAQDRLLAVKDEEIADLKNQRAWLQQRIEKLEQQSDRDRLILLSEAHTIKQLVAIEANRKSKLRATLEFFGIVPMRDPIPAPPPLSWELATTERMPAPVSAAIPQGAVTDGRSGDSVRPDSHND